MKKISVIHMNNSHNDWLRTLDFYKTDLSILKSRLTEIAGKNTATEVGKKVEHFESQFKIHRDAIDRLSHDIHMNVASTSEELQKTKSPYIDGTLLETHNTLNKKYAVEEKMINALRHDFNVFSAEWM